MTKIMKERALERREFLRVGAATLFSGFALASIGCAPTENNQSRLRAEGDVVQPIIVKDIRIGTSPNGGGIPGGVLKAKQIAAGEPVTLQAVEGSNHRHDYTISQEHFALLIAGKTVKITSELGKNGFNHTHDMIINPENNPSGFDTAEILPPTPSAKMYSALGEGEEPSFYVASTEELSEASYCLVKQKSAMQI